MNLESRVKKLEAGSTPQDTEKSEYMRRWSDAAAPLCHTMRPDHLIAAGAGVRGFFSSGGTLLTWEYAQPFTAARLLRLLNRAAQGLPASLMMPPALVDVWTAYERDIGAGATPSERWSAHHSIVTCVDCGAEHPVLRPRTWCRERRANVGPSRDYAAACVCCGGALSKSGS